MMLRSTHHALLFVLLAVPLHVHVAVAAAATDTNSINRQARQEGKRYLKKLTPDEPTVGLPYKDLVENNDNESSSTSIIHDRHSPALPNRQPYDVMPEEVETLTFTPSGGGGGGASGGEDSSLGLPFLLVIGGSVFLVLTGVIVAARKMREKKDEHDEDVGGEAGSTDNANANADDHDIEAMEYADATKDGAVSKSGKPAMDFSSIMPPEVDVEEESDSDASTHLVDSSMDTTNTTANAAANGGEDVPSPLLGDDDEAFHEEDDNALMLTV